MSGQAEQKTVSVMIRMPLEILEQIDRLRETPHGKLSRTAIIIHLIQRGLEREAEEKWR